MTMKCKSHQSVIYNWSDLLATLIKGLDLEQLRLHHIFIDLVDSACEQEFDVLLKPSL